MAVEIDLRMFLALKAGMYQLDRPWTENGRRYYTDGRVCVWVDIAGAPDSQLTHEAGGARLYPRPSDLEGSFTAGLQSSDFGPLKITKAEVEKRVWYTPLFEDEDEENMAWDIAVWVGDQMFGYDYLSRVMLLPGVEYAMLPGRFAAVFRWDLGGGVIMGIDPAEQKKE